ncbi:MAG: hypothetical protein J0L58_12530 [Burkholderiales bacterium]|nr:hypothetical protein [Burkholderiales bacterium]
MKVEKSARRLWMWACALVLAGCGGGGGGEGQPNPPPPPAPDPLLAVAAQARMQAEAAPDARSLGLSWVDGFASESGFQIERQQAGGAWTLVQEVPAGAGSGSVLNASVAGQPGEAFRVQALVDGRRYLLATVGANTQITWLAAPALMQIGTSGTEPLLDQVSVRVTGAPDGAQVRYRVGDAAFSTEQPASAAWNWDTTATPDGFQRLQASVRVGDLAWRVEVHRRVDNPPVLLKLQADQTATGLLLKLGVRLVDAVQIGGARLWVDGSLSSIPASFPRCNATTEDCAKTRRVEFAVRRVDLPAGLHRFKVDLDVIPGSAATAELEATLNDAPSLDLQRPLLSEWVADGLPRLQFTASDPQGLREWRAYLNGQLVGSGAGGNADTTLDLRAFADGVAELELVVQDNLGAETSTLRGVLLQRGAALQPDRVAVSAGMELAEGDRVLLTEAGSPRWARAGVGGTQDLEGAPTFVFQTVRGDTRLLAGVVRLPGRPDQAQAWIDATRLIHLSAPGDPTHTIHAVAVSYPWVAWASDMAVWVRNAVDGRQARVDVPAGASELLLVDGGLWLREGRPQLLVKVGPWNETFEFDALNGTRKSLPASVTPAAGWTVQGGRVAWQNFQNLRLGELDRLENAELVAPDVGGFAFTPSLLAWGERQGGVVKLRRNAQIQSLGANGSVLAAEGDLLVFSADGWIRVWDPVNGVRRLATTAQRAWVSQGQVYLQLGPEQAIYRFRP